MASLGEEVRNKQVILRDCDWLFQRIRHVRDHYQYHKTQGPWRFQCSFS